jgi:hypothetical protein
MINEHDGHVKKNNEDLEGPEYYVLPEHAIQYLPLEWRAHLESRMQDGRATLKSVDSELTALSRVVKSITALVVLKSIRDRMKAYVFKPNMESLLENEILITAFVVTYTRLHHGGDASGFSREALPIDLRAAHDEIIDFRNKRYAHNDGHRSVNASIEFLFNDKTFEIHPTLELGMYIGGALEWRRLVDFLDAMTYDRIHKLISRLQEKTGMNWVFPSAPEDE